MIFVQMKKKACGFQKQHIQFQLLGFLHSKKANIVDDQNRPDI